MLGGKYDSKSDHVKVIPVLKVNNRNVNQRFYEGIEMKVLVEEGALLSLEIPQKVENCLRVTSMRSRKVEGQKGKIRIVVALSSEVIICWPASQKRRALYQG